MAVDNLGDHGRFSDPSLLVMSSLADGPKHGYAMTKDIQRFAGELLGPGTLYGALARLQHQGLIEALPADDRRRPYRLSDQGAKLLAARLESLQRVATTGLRRLAGEEPAAECQGPVVVVVVPALVVVVLPPPLPLPFPLPLPLPVPLP